MAADHLSRLENLNLEVLNEQDINESFPDEHLFNIKVNTELSCFSDIANYLAAKVIPKDMTYQ